MKRRWTFLLALLMAMTCLAQPLIAAAQSAISNELTVTPPQTDPTQSDASTPPNLSLEMALMPDMVAPGSTTVCLLTLSNLGAPVTGQTVHVQLPKGFVPLNPEVLVYDPGTNWVTWTIAQIGTNETTTLAIDVLVPDDAVSGATHNFTATMNDKVASAVATIYTTSFKLNMTSNVKRAEPGEGVLYTITLQSIGNADASQVTVTNTVPAGMYIDPGSITEGGVLSGSTITWTADIAAGATRTFRFVGAIPTDAYSGEVFVNTATSGGLAASASVTVYEPQPQLSIAKKVNNRTPAPGTTVKYTITIKNTGGADAYDVEVIDELPEDLEINRDTISQGGTYYSRYNEIQWTVDVPAYDSVTLTYRGYVPDWMEEGDKMVNRVRITDEGLSARATLVVTEDAVPKTGYDDVAPAAWNASPKPVAQRLVAEPAQTEAADPLPPVQELFLPMRAQNEDVVGWLVVSDQVSEPILQADNNDFYMIRNFYKTDDEAGALFLDERNHLFPSDQHLLIYGHNMKSGAMFGDLDQYRELSYLQANPVFTFQSVYDAEPTTYVIVAALDASMDVGNKDYLKIRRPNFDDEADAQAYIDSLKGFSYFNIPVEWDVTDRLMSLVTCSYLQDNGRFLIVGRPLREGETVESVTAQFANVQTRA